MSCADDLTLDDITESPQVLEQVSAGGGAHTNLWGQIDRDKYVPSDPWSLGYERPAREERADS